MKKSTAYIIPLLLCFAVGGLSAWAMRGALAGWYPYLVKPALTPPNAAFPIAWSLLYICIGVSAGLVLTSQSEHRNAAVRIWLWQLALNFLWSILFFALHSPWAALTDIVILDILIVIYMRQTALFRRAAMWLFVPYLCWTLYATYLNAGIALAN